MPAPLRGTQTLVGQMNWVWNRPLLVLMEVGWRWLFGIPLLLIGWFEVQRILLILPPWSTGLASINWDNPWQLVAQLSTAWTLYEPHLLAMATWLAPIAALVWILLSGVGRWALLRRMEPTIASRPGALVLLQAVWMIALASTMGAWFYGLNSISAAHISATGEPDLVGYLIGVIVLSLSTFVVWALVSWVVSIAPLLVVLEDISPGRALFRALRLGKSFTSKLVEINLVMGIVRLALIVLATVFSAAPLPFGDQLGPESLRVVLALSMIFYLLASDYFEVVRLKSFIEFWKMYRKAG